MGSLVAALASWLDTRSARGRWLVRIENLDAARIQPAAADAILRALERLGLAWDGEVIRQSERLELYRAALARIANETYWCGCSRREIADSSLGLAADGARIYPGTCRGGTQVKRALRVRTHAEAIRFFDRVQGEQAQVIEREVGDFVLYRADGMFAYQLAAVVDDAAQGVSDVVRGADLLDSTPRQIHLQRLLGLATPRYRHVPVALDAAGQKLSKQAGAGALDLAQPMKTINIALRFLGQPEASSVDEAARNWDVSAIPRVRTLALRP